MPGFALDLIVNDENGRPWDFDIAELYQLQHDAGRYLIHEHPASATSWAEPEVRRIMQMDNVEIVTGDQC